MMLGSASGSSTRTIRRSQPKPIPVAASFASSGTPRSPVSTLRTRMSRL